MFEAGFHFEHHVILIQLSEDGRHLALTVGIVEGIVDSRGRDAEA